MRNQPPELSGDVLDALTAHIAVLDADGMIIGVNAAWRRFCEDNGGRDSRCFVRRSYLETCDSAHRASGDPAIGEIAAALRDILQGVRERYAVEYPCNSPGHERWFVLRITSCRGGGAIRAVVAHEDITERKKAEIALARTDQELRQAKRALEAANDELRQGLAREEAAARTDELTGVANRRHFFEAGGRLAEVARRYGQPLSVILLDLDRFKSINDEFGHQAGDQALQHVARTATARLRAADLFARYGGEEFVVLLPQTTLGEAKKFAERVRAAVEEAPVSFGDRRIRVTLSAGVAALISPGATLDDIIRSADQALYRAKHEGRNRVRSHP